MPKPKSQKSKTRFSAVAPKSAAAKVKLVDAKTSSSTPAAEVVASGATKPIATPAAAPVKAAAAVETAPVVVKTVVPEEVIILIQRLSDLDADVARDAASSLGQLGNVAAVEPLIASLNNADNFTHPVVRAAAAASLGQLGDRRAVEPLIAAINDSMAEASAEAIRGLGLLGDQRAVAPLISVIRNYNGYFLPIARRAAGLSLAKLGGAEAVAILREVASDVYEDNILRNDAENAIGENSNNA